MLNNSESYEARALAVVKICVASMFVITLALQNAHRFCTAYIAMFNVNVV